MSAEIPNAGPTASDLRGWSEMLTVVIAVASAAAGFALGAALGYFTGRVDGEDEVIGYYEGKGWK